MSLAFPGSIAQPNRLPNETLVLASPGACCLVRNLLHADGFVGCGAKLHDYESTLVDQTAICGQLGTLVDEGESHSEA